MGSGGRSVKLATQLHAISILWLHVLYLHFSTLLHSIQTVDLTLLLLLPFGYIGYSLLHFFVFDNTMQRYIKYARKKRWCIRNKHNYKFHKFQSYSGKINAKIVNCGEYLAGDLKLRQVHGNSNSNLCDSTPMQNRHSVMNCTDIHCYGDWNLTSHSPLNEHQTLSTRIHKVWNFISKPN
jgi:hypothetical protein